MKTKILNDAEKKLLGRREIEAEIEFERQTPKESEVQAEIAGALKADINLVKIKQIKQAYGLHKANIFAYIYNSESDLKNCERISSKERKENKKKWIEARKKKAEVRKTEVSVSAPQKQFVEENKKTNVQGAGQAGQTAGQIIYTEQKAKEGAKEGVKA